METIALMNDFNTRMRCSRTIHPDESKAPKLLMVGIRLRAWQQKRPVGPIRRLAHGFNHGLKEPKQNTGGPACYYE
jgi:hypothetical protein